MEWCRSVEQSLIKKAFKVTGLLPSEMYSFDELHNPLKQLLRDNTVDEMLIDTIGDTDDECALDDSMDEELLLLDEEATLEETDDAEIALDVCPTREE